MSEKIYDDIIDDELANVLAENVLNSLLCSTTNDSFTVCSLTDEGKEYKFNFDCYKGNFGNGIARAEVIDYRPKRFLGKMPIVSFDIVYSSEVVYYYDDEEILETTVTYTFYDIHKRAVFAFELTVGNDVPDGEQVSLLCDELGINQPVICN